ncbi:MAG: HlyD family efflux transporter periplasmic adaptor subunit, partial [Lachnospiraceae bacterium]|nr:HlyD family efflux transporter periplasmic adaptor subunit [Lachnospiraceae bacterium]
ATADRDSAQAAYDDIAANEASNIAAAQADIALATNALSAAQTAKNTAQATYNDAYTKWKNANDAIIAKENSTTDTGTNLNNQLNQAKIALTDAENALKAKQDELNDLVASIGSTRKLNEAAQAIADAQKEVDKFNEVSGASEVLAPINGTILSVNVQSGKKTSTDDPVMVIQPEGQGFVMKFSLENDKAKTISVGDTAEVTNSWWYDDVTGAVSAIRPDPSDPNRKKEVTLSLAGSLTAGQSITMTIASRTANYDYIVPSSAIRGDTKGKFVLVCESKPSPLGNRYYAIRKDVEVLAEDDTKTAIQGAFEEWGEYVITTASKSIEPGAEVRLSEN